MTLEPSALAALTIVAACQTALLLIILIKWAKDRDPKKTIMLAFLTITLLTVLTILAGTRGTSFSNMMIAPPAAILAIFFCMMYPKKQVLIQYAFFAALILLLLTSVITKIHYGAMILSPLAILTGSWLYHKTRNKDLLIFLAGIIVLGTSGMLGGISTISKVIHYTMLIPGMILLTIPFIKR